MATNSNTQKQSNCNFAVKAAFENNPAMQETYRLNHPGVELFDDVCKQDFREFKGADVVIGGPPCQGFSKANRQSRHLINQNNKLIKQYVRAIRQIRPKAFVMENVAALRSQQHVFFLENSEKRARLLERFGISSTTEKLYLLDAEHVFPGVEVLAQKYRQDNMWPENLYKAIRHISKKAKNPDKLQQYLLRKTKDVQGYLRSLRLYLNNAFTDNLGIATYKTYVAVDEALQASLEGKMPEDITRYLTTALAYQRMLFIFDELERNDIYVQRLAFTEPRDGRAFGDLYAEVISFHVLEYIEKVLGAESFGYATCSGILAAVKFGAPQKRERFILMGVRKSICADISLPPEKITDPAQYRTVRDAIADLEELEPVKSSEEDKGLQPHYPYRAGTLLSSLHDCDKVFNHINTASTELALQRFRSLKPGENFHDLSDSLKSTYADVARTQNTIYLRLNYDEPSGTVVNIRKSMWIHPVKDRAVSIREAARLQTFPDSFRFCGCKNAQYQQVGNAVPPLVARAIADHLAAILTGQSSEEHKDTTSDDSTSTPAPAQPKVQ